jgi:hypothetical protein
VNDEDGSWNLLLLVIVGVRMEKGGGVCLPDFVTQEIKE